MKKIFMAIAAMTMLIATSCKESVNTPEDLVPGDGEFLVTIANAPRQEAPTNGKTVKTVIVGNDIRWTVGDVISINGVNYETDNSNATVIFRLSEGSGAQKDADGKYKAYYPAEIDPTNTGRLPETIQYNGGNLKNLPMYAESKNNVLTFHNICAALNITVPVACNKIVISADENLAGEFSIEYDATSTPMAVLSTTAEGMSKTVTVNGTFTAGAPVYVALPAGTYNNFTVKFNNGDEVLRHRTLSKPLTLNVNNLYKLSFDVNVRDDEFCFTAKEDGCTLKLNQYGNVPVCSLEYYTTGTGWTSYDMSGDGITITLNEGDKVYFRAGEGGNSTLATDTSNYYHFSSTGKVAVSGNVMYLLNQNGLQNLTTKVNDYAFCYLFKNMTDLEDASGLILPAKTLAENCYENMFNGCTSLTAAPSLPATTLNERCYCNMFKNCSSLTAAPSLPAKTLLIGCYYGMFQGCTSLTAAPDLHATTFASYCYQNMFNGCRSLGVSTTKIEGAKTLVVPSNVYLYTYWGKDMFNGCTGFSGNPQPGGKYYFYDAGH